jgi:hypothetical protein
VRHRFIATLHIRHDTSARSVSAPKEEKRRNRIMKTMAKFAIGAAMACGIAMAAAAPAQAGVSIGIGIPGPGYGYGYGYAPPPCYGPYGYYDANYCGYYGGGPLFVGGFWGGGWWHGHYYGRGYYGRGFSAWHGGRPAFHGPAFNGHVGFGGAHTSFGGHLGGHR